MSFLEGLWGSEEVETTQEIAELENQVIDSFIKYFKNEMEALGFDRRQIRAIGIDRELVKLSLQNQDIRSTIADNIYKMEAENKKDPTGSIKEHASNMTNLLYLKRKQEHTALKNNLADSRKNKTFEKTAAFYSKLGGDKRARQEEERESQTADGEQTKASTESNNGDTDNSNTNKEKSNNEESNNVINTTQDQHIEQNQDKMASHAISYAGRFLGKRYLSNIIGHGNGLYAGKGDNPNEIQGLDCSGLVSQGLREMGIIKPDQYLRVPSLCRANKHLTDSEGHKTIATTTDAVNGESFEIKSKEVSAAKPGDRLFWYSKSADPYYTRCGGLHHVAMIQGTENRNGVMWYNIIESNGAEGVVKKRVNPVTYCAGAGGSIPVIQTPDYDAIKNTYNPA